jgi:hypothetical protein
LRPRIIDETYGRAAVLEIAYSEVEVTSDVAQGMLGSSLAEVDAAWEQWVSARYAATLDADALAQAYRRKRIASGSREPASAWRAWTTSASTA